MGLTVMSPSPKSFSANFELDGNPQQGTLSLSTALGISVATLSWSPESATLRAQGDIKTWPSLGAMSLATLGTDLPLGNLFDWLAGVPSQAEGWEVDLGALREGRLTARRTGPDLQAELKLLLEAD